MPRHGLAPSLTLIPCHRPDLSIGGYLVTNTEHQLPSDVTDLWNTLVQLPLELRRSFFQSGTLWRLALYLGHEFQTASFAFMVAACEALKPSNGRFRDNNVYDVIESLLGKGQADSLRRASVRLRTVRNAQFHRGELLGSEFVKHAMMSSNIRPASLVPIKFRVENGFGCRRRSTTRRADSDSLRMMPTVEGTRSRQACPGAWLARKPARRRIPAASAGRFSPILNFTP